VISEKLEVGKQETEVFVLYSSKTQYKLTSLSSASFSCFSWLSHARDAGR